MARPVGKEKEKSILKNKKIKKLNVKKNKNKKLRSENVAEASFPWGKKKLTEQRCMAHGGFFFVRLNIIFYLIFWAFQFIEVCDFWQ